MISLATVTQASPLRVQMDGATVDSDAAYVGTAPGLGDRVIVTDYGRTLLVIAPGGSGGGGGGGEGEALFIQDTAPVTALAKYAWIDTSVDPPELWVEDGAP